MKLDIEELNSLLEQANRQRTKDILMLEVKKLQTEMTKLLEQKNTSVKNTSSLNTAQRCYEVKLNNYGWDQTNTTMKIYISLSNVHQLPKEAIVCTFTEKSLDLRIFGLEKLSLAN